MFVGLHTHWLVWQWHTGHLLASLFIMGVWSQGCQAGQYLRCSVTHVVALWIGGVTERPRSGSGEGSVSERLPSIYPPYRIHIPIHPPDSFSPTAVNVTWLLPHQHLLTSLFISAALTRLSAPVSFPMALKVLNTIAPNNSLILLKQAGWLLLLNNSSRYKIHILSNLHFIQKITRYFI